MFNIVLDRKPAFADYKNIHLKKSKNWRFSKGVIVHRFGQSFEISSSFFLGQIGYEKVFRIALDRKPASVDYKNIKMYGYVRPCTATSAMYGHARLCTAMQGYIRLCTTIYNNAQLCTAMHDYARLCTSMYEHARLWTRLRTAMYGYVRRASYCPFQFHVTYSTCDY